jgi:hypothetical protein
MTGRATENPRAFLEAVVNSTDPAVTLKERLDALRQLQELGLAAGCRCFVREVEELDEREVAFLEAELGGKVDVRLAEVVAEIETGSRGYPRAGGAVRRLVRAEVERRAAGESGEVARLRAEVAALREQLRERPKRGRRRKEVEAPEYVPPRAEAVEPEPEAPGSLRLLPLALVAPDRPRQSAIRRWAR